MKRILVGVALVLGCGPASKSSTTPGGAGSGEVAAAKVLVNVNAEGVALGGYDPMGYRTFDKPVTGVPEHTAVHGGATYQFSSADQLASFNGDEHAPRYGGYCAYAASQGRLSESNPAVFEIVEGKLLVFTNPEFRDLFDQDRAGNLANADAAWPELVAKHGK